MSRLIDADKLMEQKFKNPISYNAFVNLVKRQPTIEPKRGHWTEHEFGLICSECGHYTEAMYDEPFNNEFGKGWALKRPYYCGYCGAKMDEVTE